MRALKQPNGVPIAPRRSSEPNPAAIEKRVRERGATPSTLAAPALTDRRGAQAWKKAWLCRMPFAAVE